MRRTTGWIVAVALLGLAGEAAAQRGTVVRTTVGPRGGTRTVINPPGPGNATVIRTGPHRTVVNPPGPGRVVIRH